MSYHFGIHPWDVDRLTYDELAAYREALADINREAAASKARRL